MGAFRCVPPYHRGRRRRRRRRRRRPRPPASSHSRPGWPPSRRWAWPEVARVEPYEVAPSSGVTLPVPVVSHSPPVPGRGGRHDRAGHGLGVGGDGVGARVGVRRRRHDQLDRRNDEGQDGHDGGQMPTRPRAPGRVHCRGRSGPLLPGAAGHPKDVVAHREHRPAWNGSLSMFSPMTGTDRGALASRMGTAALTVCRCCRVEELANSNGGSVGPVGCFTTPGVLSSELPRRCPPFQRVATLDVHVGTRPSDGSSGPRVIGRLYSLWGQHLFLLPVSAPRCIRPSLQAVVHRPWPVRHRVGVSTSSGPDRSGARRVRCCHGQPSPLLPSVQSNGSGVGAGRRRGPP